MRVARPRVAAARDPALPPARPLPRLPLLLPSQLPFPSRIHAVFSPCGLRASILTHTANNHPGRGYARPESGLGPSADPWQASLAPTKEDHRRSLRTRVGPEETVRVKSQCRTVSELRGSGCLLPIYFFDDAVVRWDLKQRWLGLSTLYVAHGSALPIFLFARSHDPKNHCSQLRRAPDLGFEGRFFHGNRGPFARTSRRRPLLQYAFRVYPFDAAVPQIHESTFWISGEIA